MSAPWFTGQMRLTSRRLRIAAVLTIAATLAGCSPKPASVQPDVDAAVVATLPGDFASAFTSFDDDSGECLTVVALLPERYGLTARMAQDAIDLLRAGAEELSCRGVLRIVDDEGNRRDVSHLAKYLAVRDRDGDLVIL